MKVQRIFRFPVKGLPAEELSSARVSAGGGLNGDRAVAFSNGSREVIDGRWDQCLSFTILKNDKSLQQWDVTSDPPLITVTAPEATGAQPLTFNASDPDSRAEARDYFARYLPAQGGHTRQLVSTGAGIFDSRLSGISLINPETVKVLSRAAGVELDPRRYRGNLLLEGLAAFKEFDLIGKVLRIGQMRMLITKSIERCSATSVNPESTRVDVNGPRLLATHFGHLHCGIYGTVLEAGEISAGDTIHVEENPVENDERIPVKRTPHFVELLRTEPVDGDSVELTLRDPLGWFGKQTEPGTYLRLHLSEPLWRNYTIVSTTDNEVTVAVRIQGEMSARLARMQPGQQILASGPYGMVTAGRVLSGRTALVTAGIGITASLGLLGGEQVPAGLKELRIIHVERQVEGQLFARLRQRAADLDLTHTVSHFDSTVARPGLATLSALVAGCDTAVICGPQAFTELALEACHRAGIAPAQIHREAFVSPVTNIEQQLQRYAPARVECTQSTTHFTWTPKDGVLLEALEAHGVATASSCRAGSCGQCALTLLRGTVDYIQEPSARIDEGQILTCQAVPTGDLELSI